MTALGDVEAFRLGEMPRGDLYLKGSLVEAIRDTGMSVGTDFTAVYEESCGS